MISKIIPPGKSFPGLCRYLYENKSRAEVILSAGVRDYDHSKMATDFAVQAAQNPRLKSPVLHIILSWPPEEKVDQELMSNIAKDYLERMNIIDTQFVVIKHNDRDHQHVHLVINRVDNNGRTVKDNYIGLKGKKVAQQLTLQYGLKVAEKKDLSHSHLERLNGYDAQRYQLFTIIHDLLPYCKNFEELERRLSQYKIGIQYKYKGHTKEIQGISFCKGELKFKGSDIDRSFSYLKLQKLFTSQSHQQTIYKRERLRMRIEPENLGQSNHAAKLLYELMKPEFTPDFVPYELTRKKSKIDPWGIKNQIMSDLLLQAMVERLEAQDFLLKEMSKDADKGQVEVRKKFDELKTDIALLKSEKQEHPDVKQLTLAVESLRILLSQKITVGSKRHFLCRKSTWIFVGISLFFLGMSWCWGYTFRAWSAAEMDGMKYRYLKTVPNPSLLRFCRMVDSLSDANLLPVSYTPITKPAGEKEKAPRISSRFKK